MNIRGSMKSSRKLFDGLNQILPGGLNAFLYLRELRIVRLLEVHNATLELSEPRADILQFEIVFEPYADSLFSKLTLQNGYAGGQIFDFVYHTIQVRFL